MNFESSAFNTPQNQSEKKSTTNTFLREQIRLPEEKWSPEFRKLLNETFEDYMRQNEKRLRRRSGEEVEEEESPEAQREQAFDWYKKQLGLREEDLRGKRIMDLGFGGGGFVKHLIAKGITPEAYGIDIDPSEDDMEKAFEGHLFKQSSEEDLPVQDLDYIVANRSIWHDWEPGDDDGYVMNVENVLEKSLSALKKGGEMRIYPIEEGAKQNLARGDDEEEQEKWNALLPKLSKKYGLKYEFEPRNILVFPGVKDDKYIVLQSVLILRKQADNPEAASV